MTVPTGAHIKRAEDLVNGWLSCLTGDPRDEDIRDLRNSVAIALTETFARAYDAAPRRLAWHRISDDWVEVVADAQSVAVIVDGCSSRVEIGLDRDAAVAVRDALSVWLTR